MIAAVRDGFAALRRSWGLAVVLLVSNALTAALLAVPLARQLETDLRGREAGRTMMYGFDVDWWGEWQERQTGWAGTLSPLNAGVAGVYANAAALLQGWLPAGLPATDALGRPEPETAVLLGLGVAYLLLQSFLAGGVLATLRGVRGTWTTRSLLHGSGFYFGRLLRVTLIAVLAQFLLFRIAYVPLALWTDKQALEAVSEATAMAWTIGRNAALLLAILFVSMLSSYAKVIVVVEERASALLAFTSAAGFCVRHLLRTYGHYLLMALLLVLSIAAWAALDAAWVTTGYKTQLVALALMEGLVLMRLALRVATAGGQMALYRRLALGGADGTRQPPYPSPAPLN